MNPKDRIVEAAARLFYTQGYNNTGINQLIKAAKVAKASFYEYFPSKEHLLLEYLRVAAEHTNASIRAAVENATTPKEKVLAVFDLLLLSSPKTQYNGCNFLNILAEIPQGNKEVKMVVRSQKNHIRSVFGKILGRGKKDRLADELYLLFDAALSTSKVYEDTWPIETSKRLAERLV